MSKFRASKNRVTVVSTEPRNPNCMKTSTTAKATPAAAVTVRALLYVRLCQASGVRVCIFGGYLETG